MADISSNFSLVRWLRAKAEPYADFSDDFLYATMVGRGITESETMLSDASDKQRDLCLADIYYAIATSSVKTGTQGESDGGWTHYVAIKNTSNRPALLRMAKLLYDRWGEAFLDPTNKIGLKPLY